VSSVVPTRESLIANAMLYSPAHGDTAFTVPLFDLIVVQVMPRDLGRNAGDIGAPAGTVSTIKDIILHRRREISHRRIRAAERA
jgi:hypothetical protein